MAKFGYFLIKFSRPNAFFAFQAPGTAGRRGAVYEKCINFFSSQHNPRRLPCNVHRLLYIYPVYNFIHLTAMPFSNNKKKSEDGTIRLRFSASLYICGYSITFFFLQPVIKTMEITPAEATIRATQRLWLLLSPVPGLCVSPFCGSAGLEGVTPPIAFTMNAASAGSATSRPSSSRVMSTS